VEIIHVETPDNTLQAFVHPGLGEQPLHACSSAKAIAAFAEGEIQEDIINSICEIPDSEMRPDHEALTRDYQSIREPGFAQCDQEIDLESAA